MFVPAANEKFVRKASSIGADAIILDLEDSVAASEKDRACANLASAVPDIARSGQAVFVRVNASSRLQDDVVAAVRAGAQGVVLPKVQGEEGIHAVDVCLAAESVEERFSIIPVLEHPVAILRAEVIANASRRIIGLITGGEDLGLAMDADPESEAVRMSKYLVHLAAKSAGLMSFGLFGSISDYRDLEGLARRVEEARKSGFDGATCIHPSAVPVLNQGFFPSPEQVSFARRLLSAHAHKPLQGAFEFEGRMVDIAHIHKARRTLCIVDAQG